MTIKTTAKTAPVTYVVTDRNGRVVKPGSTIIDFRGDKATFLAVTRGPLPGKSAKVWVEADGSKRELYCTVFDLTVQPEHVARASRIVAVSENY